MKPTKSLWMEMPLNREEPLVMHIDMNSCFATMEQQANPLLRGKPVGVAAYASDYGCLISPSYEAKAKGVFCGMRVREARAVCPEIVIIQSNPPLYRDAHLRFKRIFESYTDDVTPKSIDEAVINFKGSEIIRRRNIVDIGYEIKDRVHAEIGDWVNVNVGISTNRFLAKTAAGIHKPNGLDVITHENVLDVYSKMTLLDVTGINRRYKARLNLAGIMTPMEFYNAPRHKLHKEVFKSIVGYYWYLKLRGWECEDFHSPRRTIGHNYTLQDRTNQIELLPKFMMKLCEKTGRRLRRNNYVAEGVDVWVAYQDFDFWHHGMKVGTDLYTTEQIYYYAKKLLNMRPYDKTVVKMGVTVFGLKPCQPEQCGLFDKEHGDKRELSRSLDDVNDRYGDMVISSALLADTDGFILDRISFGGVKDLQDLYAAQP